jgi:hypothetical protein
MLPVSTDLLTERMPNIFLQASVNSGNKKSVSNYVKVKLIIMLFTYLWRGGTNA